MATLRILGVDPGSRKAGWGVIDVVPGTARVTHVDNGAIFLDADAPLFARLLTLGNALDEIVTTYAPHVAAVEDVFVAKGARSALILGQARGATLLTLARRDLIVDTQNALQVKSRVTGRGRATKAQVTEMVRVILSLPEHPFEDAADALAVAISSAVGQLDVRTRATLSHASSSLSLALSSSKDARASRTPANARGRKGLEALARRQGKVS